MCLLASNERKRNTWTINFTREILEWHFDYNISHRTLTFNECKDIENHVNICRKIYHPFSFQGANQKHASSRYLDILQLHDLLC